VLGSFSTPNDVFSAVRIAVLSDIHSNLEALTRALEGVESAGVDAIYCLGDVVGYNADPAACLELVREHCDGVVLGNHDAAVATEAPIDSLPADGQKAARHNRSCLSEEQRAYLADLPLTLTVENCTFVHATPDEPTAWKRLTTYPAAQDQFAHFDTDVCFIGHTHVPAVMADTLGIFQVRQGHRYLVNVGSVGQPRDQNPKLSFGLFDTDTFDYHPVRMTYDVDGAAQKIRDTDALPNRLADRLYDGL
jgi:predicted phosphodiesterase